MMHTFKTSSSPEVTALIKKHSTTNALFIKNLSYFTDVALKDIDEIGVQSMKTGVRYIAQALMDNAGLTKAEYRVLLFWSNQLAGAKVPFLTARAHTIIDARGNSPFSKYDIGFIDFVASSIKSEVASTDKTLADFAKEHGDILKLAYEASKTSDHVLQFYVLEKLNAAMAQFAIILSQSETLVAIETAIAELECISKGFTSCQAFLDKQLQHLRQKREALKK